MTAFVAPIDDIVFSLRHVARADRVDGWDDNLAQDILQHFGSFAERVIAPLNATGDAEGARLENGRVVMPAGFVDAYKQLSDDGWQGLTAPSEHGGMAVSPVLAAGVSEIFSGANHSMQMVCNLVPGAIKTLLRFGTIEQQTHWIPKLASGEFLSTMCLTEPDAGSDLSAIRCAATRVEDAWAIDGEKIYISGGDQDMSKGILHLVLARSDRDDKSLKGLSLFLCEAQPGIKISRIENKLGLHASPTCQLQFESASADLIGEEGEGLKAIFTLMNYARIDVALQGVAHAAQAAGIALAYATERKQGKRSDGTAACLVDHADVQRMLNEQQRLSHTNRAICHIALTELSTGERPALLEFLTPLCKISGSEAGIKAADLAIQILGGYGYTNESGVSQIWRDARITAIYEGANGIHARTLVTRGLRSGGGANEFAQLVLELGDGDPRVDKQLADWRDQVEQISAESEPERFAHQFVESSKRLLERAVWCRILSVVKHHPRSEQLKKLANSISSDNI